MDRRTFFRISGISAWAFTTFGTGNAHADDAYKICVVAILATDQNAVVDKRLVELAKEVQKKNPKLTGFRVANTAIQKVTISETKTFILTDGQTVDITLNASKTEESKLTITLKPPKLGQVSYNCVLDRAFSMATQHFTKDNEQLFFAVTAKLPDEKEPAKEKPKEPAKKP